MSFSSEFSAQLASDASIVDLMADLGDALNVNPDLLFLGGGNPARVRAFEARAAQHLASIAEDPDEFHRLIGIYQSPRGSEAFIGLLTKHLSERGWPVTERNIALTSGSQSAFFMLINLLAGSSVNRQQKKICLPLVPEYLGYADQGLSPETFYSVKPKIELIGERGFRYHINFDELELGQDIGAICVSRPTNPSGNMLSDAELEQLAQLARQHDIPLIVDCAYGQPFPGVVYGEHSTKWQPHTIYVLSLSKLGMPGVRTGIVIADEGVIDALVHTNTVISLANGNLGPALVSKMIEAGELDAICRETILPFYKEKLQWTLAMLEKYFDGIDYRVHEADGAFFLWLWFPSLKVSSSELYQRLKQKNVLIMDGQHFFYQQAETWPHAQQCIRITYCAEKPVLERAISIMAEELKALSNSSRSNSSVASS